MFRHEVGIDRLEDQPAEDDKLVFRYKLALAREWPRVRQRNRNNKLSLAKNLHRDLVPFELALDDFGHFDRLPVHGYGAITRNGQTVDCQQHVSWLQASFGYATAVDAADKDAGVTSVSPRARRIVRLCSG